jgi:hypothetical protein
MLSRALAGGYQNKIDIEIHAHSLVDPFKLSGEARVPHPAATPITPGNDGQSTSKKVSSNHTRPLIHTL